MAFRFQESPDGVAAQKYIMDFVKELKSMPVAIETDAANEQHYEVPTEYFLLCLGKHLKYSSCIYETGKESLAEAEEAMLSYDRSRSPSHISCLHPPLFLLLYPSATVIPH